MGIEGIELRTKTTYTVLPFTTKRLPINANDAQPNKINEKPHHFDTLSVDH